LYNRSAGTGPQALEAVATSSNATSYYTFTNGRDTERRKRSQYAPRVPDKCEEIIEALEISSNFF
jgi:hypothetical protein